MEVKGRIHSYESFGAVDGPGIRFIVFFQGCLMKCKYCHNRDTWDLEGGTEVTVDDLMNKVLPYKHYMIASDGGGVTASGGEALLQTPFIKEWFKECHKHGISTCLDTNGFLRHYDKDLEELIDNTDTVLLDLKHLDDTKHIELTGVSNKYTLEFFRYLKLRGINTWIRQVIVPGYTDNLESIRLLGEFIKGAKNIVRVELLPYHTLGTFKWADMHKDYPLAGVEPPSKETMEMLKNELQKYYPHVVY